MKQIRCFEVTKNWTVICVSTYRQIFLAGISRMRQFEKIIKHFINLSDGQLNFKKKNTVFDTLLMEHTLRCFFEFFRLSFIRISATN